MEMEYLMDLSVYSSVVWILPFDWDYVVYLLGF